MWHCFLTGASKDPSGKRILKVLHSIEYLTYDLLNRAVKVWADFIVENLSDTPTRLRGLHRGNIEFEFKTEDWLKDERWTPILREIAGEYISLRVNGDGIFVCQVGADPLPITLLKDTGKIVRTWSPRPASEEVYTCFTGWESPLVKPKSCCLFRIVGTIQGETYERLMGEHCGERIRIMGGEPLENKIRDDLKGGISGEQEYAQEYRRFLDEYNDKPNFYHVFLEFADNRDVKLLEVSEDMRKRVLNEEVHGRHVSWFCSEMDFNIFARANGPVLVVAANKEAQNKDLVVGGKERR